MAPQIKQPNAIIVIYNYRDRLGDFSLTQGDQMFEVDQIILNSLSLKSVSTQRSKSNPTGAFEFRLAPIKNWVTAITPGSWCVIQMSNNHIDASAKYGRNTVNEKSFKMMGRIESVRGVSSVNQVSGARETEYIVTGSDWGAMFNNKFYLDPLNRTPNQSAMGMAERFGYIDYLVKSLNYNSASTGTQAAANFGGNGALNKAKSDVSATSIKTTNNFIQAGSGATATTSQPTAVGVQKDEKVKLPSAIDNVNFILSLWGRSDPQTANVKNETGLLAKSKQIFRIPNQLAKFMKFIKEDDNTTSPIVADILKQIGGKLTGYDIYEDKDASCGIIDFNTILGEHTIWQIITNNSNELINELIPEIRFTNSNPTLALYNRVRPFTINDEKIIKKDTNAVGDGGSRGLNVVEDVSQTSQKSKVDPYLSKYSSVRRKTIASNDVLVCNYGTNWRDRVNFIEVTIARTLFQEAYAADIKLDSQFSDESSIGRDGLLSMIVSTSYVPAETGIANPAGVSAYKHALKEWYFNTHKMFNGTLNLVGQDQYIQVGDNILVESKVLNRNYNTNIEQKTPKTPATYMLAHVEGISHQATIDANGARIFTTTIEFVRGIITDINGNIKVGGSHVGAVDQDASLLDIASERNRETVWNFGPLDPDVNGEKE